jgi:diacylglycerol kinase family enzyme
MTAVPEAIRTKPWQVRMRIDGADLETALYWMVIGNTRSYGGFRDITLRAVADDGRLDVALMQRGGLFHLGVDGLRVLLHRHDRSPNVRYTSAAEVVIETEGLPVQVDGEPIGETPVQVEVAAAALTVIVPRGLRSPLFSKPAPDAGAAT